MDSNASRFDPIVVVKGSEKRPNFFKRIQAPFSKLSMPNKKIAGIVAALLLVFGVGLGTILTQRQTQLAPKASVNGIDLSLQPSTQNVAKDESFVLDVFLDGKEASVSGAQVKVNFDQSKLTLQSVNLTGYMPSVLMDPVISAGTAEFMVGTSNPKGGTGTLAKLNFKAIADTATTQITFDSGNTIVTVLGLGTNQAGDLSSATVNIGSSNHGDPRPAYFSIEASASATVNQTFTATLIGHSDEEAANLFSAKINFPANLVEVESINTNDTFVTSWAEKFYDNTTGQISLVGGIPNPGYKSEATESGEMAIITFKAKAPGNALIDLTDQSQIFSNSTNQNILDSMTDDNVMIDCGAAANCVNPSPIASPSPSVSPSPVASPSVNCATLKGDGNGDCTVNLTDLSIMLSNFSAVNPVPNGKQLLDFNDDNRINSVDFSRMADKLFQLGVVRRRS